MQQTITPDFLMSQLRLALVAVLAYGGGAHWFTPEAAGLYLTLFTTLGPIVIPWAWSIFSNLGRVSVVSGSAAATVAAVEKKDPASASAGAATAVAGTVVKILLIAFLLSAFLAVPSAHAQVRKPALTGNPIADIKTNFEKTTGVKPTGDVPFDLLKALDKALLPDLKYAQRLAVATGSKVTAPCYGAWIDMINTQQTAVTDPPVPPATEGVPTPEPDPDLVTKFERMVELRNALQPDSPFMTACSPVANMVKMDVTAFMGIVISGGAGLATLVPGL